MPCRNYSLCLAIDFSEVDVVSKMINPVSSKIARNGRSRVLLQRFVFVFLLIGLASPARGEVAVLANRTRQEIVVQVSSAGEVGRTLHFRINELKSYTVSCE